MSEDIFICVETDNESQLVRNLFLKREHEYFTMNERYCYLIPIEEEEVEGAT